jgi:phospholipase C
MAAVPNPNAPTVRGTRRRSRWRSRGVIVILVVVLLVGSAVGAYYLLRKPPSAPPGPYVPPSTPELDKIKHIFIIDQENRAFDSYFGTYCTTVGPDCSDTSIGTPTGVCLLYNLSTSQPGQCVAPFPYPPGMTMTDDIGHAWANAHEAYDGGKMDGFVSAIQGNPLAMGYYTGQTLGGYWDLAEQYALGDYFFSGALSYSLPNHWLIVAGSAPNASYYSSNFTNPNGSIDSTGTSYLNEANDTPTLMDQLINSSVSWKYYDFTIPTGSYAQAIANGTVWKYWNVLVSKASTYQPIFASHFVPNQQIFSDLASGSAPNVSWIIPTAIASEHPPYDVLTGQNWTLSVINAIENSSIWNSSAIFLTWDEYGGFYDSVLPPTVDGFGLGFRVPLLVVSPYVRENFVNPANGSFGSILQFVEARYGFHAVGTRDALAPNLYSYFDFNQTPRAPFWIPPMGAQYPDPTGLQALASPATPLVTRDVLEQGTLSLNWSDGPGAPPLGYEVRIESIGGSVIDQITLGQETHSLRLAGLGSGPFVVQIGGSRADGSLGPMSVALVGYHHASGVDLTGLEQAMDVPGGSSPLARLREPA